MADKTGTSFFPGRSETPRAAHPATVAPCGHRPPHPATLVQTKRSAGLARGLPQHPAVAQRAAPKESDFGGMAEKLQADLQKAAEVYRKASVEQKKQRPATYCHAIDVTSYNLASAASGYGWPGCQINGTDPVPNTWPNPQAMYAEIDEGLAAILKEACGGQYRWQGLNCAEPKAVANLLKRYPATKLGNVAIVTVWVSDGTLAPPCGICQNWVYKYLHSVNGSSEMGDLAMALGAKKGMGDDDSFVVDK